ncbi:hypothetical protein C8T65DRAFT_124979 [Cerioporus squamosus]|nr:hypothetical protein C8T65DRAFT_124979 [Cerioporus squamosus]
MSCAMAGLPLNLLSPAAPLAPDVLTLVYVQCSLFSLPTSRTSASPYASARAPRPLGATGGNTTVFQHTLLRASKSQSRAACFGPQFPLRDNESKQPCSLRPVPVRRSPTPLAITMWHVAHGVEPRSTLNITTAQSRRSPRILRGHVRPGTRALRLLEGDAPRSTRRRCHRPADDANRPMWFPAERGMRIVYARRRTPLFQSLLSPSLCPHHGAGTGGVIPGEHDAGVRPWPDGATPS